MNKKKNKSKQKSLITAGLIAVLSVTAVITGISGQTLQKVYADDHHNEPRHHHEHHKHHQHDHNYFDSYALYPLTDAGVGD